VLHRWKARVHLLKRDTYALYLACRHPATPWYAKLFAAGVAAYAVSPIDLIPDFIPVVGYLDDLILVPIGIALAVKMIPRAVMDECRAEAESVVERPTSWLAGAVIVSVWLATVATLALFVYRALA
jgi:uncharacterized membrane protein YkvA (DUF1232 family)